MATNAGLRGVKGRETEDSAARALAVWFLISAAVWALLAFALGWI
jgi:hypothetical protein